MRRTEFIAASLVLVAGCLVATMALAAPAGERDIAVATPGRQSLVHARVWYPAASGGRGALIGANGVFRGARAFQDAPILDGRFPLVLIAFGGLRAAPDEASWLAATLAARGFIAAIVNPPPIPEGPARQSVLSELWLRPADLSAAITEIEKAPALTAHIDADKVGGIGFFLGGYAILALAGARIDPGAYARSCDGPAPGLDCAWFAKGGVDLHRVDPARLGRSNRDPRLKIAIAVDPELSAVLTRQSLGAISASVRIIALGPKDRIPPPLDASRLAAEMPAARYLVIEGATPFDSFPECKPGGAAILASAGGETELCDDSQGEARASVHARLAATIIAMLRHSSALR